MFLFKKINHYGFSLIEVILSGSLFILLSIMLTGGIIYGQESSLKGALRSRAVFLAEEGLEAIRSIRNNNFNSLPAGVYGVSNENGQWALSANSTYVDNFLREIKIIDLDNHQKKIISKVIWLSENNLENSVSLTTILTDWPFINSENLDAGVCSAP